MGHERGTSAAGAHRGRLLVVFLLTSAVLILEVVGGLLSGSLALLADAGHMLTDAAGIGLALLAIWFAARPATPARTFGYYRVEILAAVVNAVLLFGVAGFVLLEAWRRLQEPPEVASGLMLAVALVGLVANAVSMWLLRRGQAESLNLRGAYLEVLGDLLGSVAVLLAAAVIVLTDFQAADPIASAVIGLLILPRTWRLLREAVDVLLEATQGRGPGRGASPRGRDIRGSGCARPARLDHHQRPAGALGPCRSRAGRRRRQGSGRAGRLSGRPLRH
jgi:cobalt-zinc-cadmium efflux system protein